MAECLRRHQDSLQSIHSPLNWFKYILPATEAVLAILSNLRARVLLAGGHDATAYDGATLRIRPDDIELHVQAEWKAVQDEPMAAPKRDEGEML